MSSKTQRLECLLCDVSCVVTTENIVRALFPIYPEQGRADFRNIGDFPIFKVEELELVVKTVKDRKLQTPVGSPVKS